MGKSIYIGNEVLEFLNERKEDSYNKTLRKLLGIDVPREQLATKGELSDLKDRIDKVEDFIERHR